ncbi:calmodulin-binding protein 60 A-like [Impatiens glandulifera]|uniref:calmodulin-binding protein 60 A-like n=1 Tax=Impatiens glandulifera TaxID=253017 RepID=UPI001FB07026|nr:calmodulin-binding protein 60 A-like [Impatiens glandulifera]
MRGMREKSFYVFQGNTLVGDKAVVAEPQDVSPTSLWHMRLGNVSERGLKELSKRGYFGNEKFDDLEFCENCIYGKAMRVKFGQSVEEGDRVDNDPWLAESSRTDDAANVTNNQNNEINLALSAILQVKEEIGLMNPRTFDRQMRILKLHFLNKLDKQVLSGSKIVGENGNSIQVALIDESTSKIVNSGPGASSHVQIFVLESYQLLGEEDLNQKINKESETNKSLLHGNIFVYLNEGIGCINDLYFAHTSQWLKKREFVLVATVVGNCNGITVKAAVMEPFTIKDRRNTLYVKHPIPTPSDDIWRLKNIIKGGPMHKSLRTNDINIVQTFLREFNLNPQRLRKHQTNPDSRPGHMARPSGVVPTVQPMGPS